MANLKYLCFLNHFYNLEKSPLSTTDVFLLVCLSLCAGRPDVVFLAITALKLLHNKWHVVIDIQGNVLQFLQSIM